MPLGRLQPVGRNPRRQPPPDLEEHLPTPLEPEARRPPIVIDPIRPGSAHRSLWILGQLLAFMARRFRLKLSGRLDDATDAVMTRRLFERLSGMWIKVGQLLSLRADLMSDAMCRELASLQYQMRGFPPAIARRVVEEDLGKPLTAVFAHFEPEPFAAASIAQVHRATLLTNNRAVVVKVMRPDVERNFERDLRLLGHVVRFFKLVGLFKRFRLDDAMLELRAIFEEEVDYQHEGVNLRRMRRNLRRHGIYVPRVVGRLSRRRVLVMEEVAGVLMSDYIRLRRDDPERVYRWSVLNGVDSDAVARRLSITVFRQILEENEFHGDLHPGNIVLLADNRIALIDFGSVGRLHHHIWTLYRQSLHALATRDYERSADYMVMMSPSTSPSTNRRVRREMAEVLQRWEFDAQMFSATYADRSIAAMSREIARVMATHNMPLNWGIMRVGRTFSTLDASVQTLAPNADFMKLCRAYYRDQARRRKTRQGRTEAWQSGMQHAAAVFGDFQILVGGVVREQALRMHGSLDRGAHVRLTLLIFMSRGVWLLLAFALVDFLFDQAFSSSIRPGWLAGLYHTFVEPGVVHLPKLYWMFVLLFGIYLSRLIRATRNSIVRG
jgi:ubiquinone biosynthesis protein